MAVKDSAIRTQNLAKSFNNSFAVKNLNLTVSPGEIFGLVGPDGAGKSTIFRMLAGIMSPSEGEIQIAGYDVFSTPEKVKQQVAYMSQRFGLYPDLTVLENIKFYADLYGVPRKGKDEQINNLLDFSFMRPFKHRCARDLSGGMKQKLQLICALIHTPKVLLLDEPTSGVDPVSRRDFWRILYRIAKQDVAILVSTTYLDEAERCGKVGLLNNGNLIAAGSPEDIKKLMKGKVLAIRSPRAREIAGLLLEELSWEGVSICGDQVHIICRDLEAQKNESRFALEQAGLPFDEMQETEPSLEDVFLNILGEDRGSFFEKKKNKTATRPLFKKAHKIAVQAQGLTRRFGSFVAVNSMSFDVFRGEIFGFLGPNGAGKSTVIRMLCGLLEPTGGEGTVGGFDIKKEAEMIKRNIGYMSQKFSLYDDLTVEENINFYGGIYGLGGQALQKRKEWALQMTGLIDYQKTVTGILSGGWRQRLAMACAILHEPPIVFLDEPTSGVDPLSRRHFWDLIYSMSDNGVTIFVTTHYMDEAEYCDRIALVYRGSLIALDSPRKLKSHAMHEKILSILCERPQDVMDDLAKLSEVREVALFGAGLHAVVDNVERAEKEVREELVKKSIRIDQIASIEPTMEDVFVSLIEEVDRNNQKKLAVEERDYA